MFTAVSRKMRWSGRVVCMGETRNAYAIFVGKPEGKRLLRRPRRRLGDNIRMDFREIGSEIVDWFHLIQDWSH
jgi:hypothetical protein